MTSQDTFGLVTSSTRSDFFFRAVCVTNKTSRFSCFHQAKIHHELENHCKELFATELNSEIFCCITSYDNNCNPKRGLVT